MELVRGLHNLRERHRGSVVTIGNYDGVHRGHQHMLEATRRKADELGLPVTVITFEPTGVARGGWHKLEVRVNRARARVQSRSGYYSAQP